MPGEIPDEPKPVVYRYGKLPQGLPAYFTVGDSDKDGQIGLYEWVKLWEVSQAKLEEFKALDLNGDGLLTAEEYLRYQKSAASKPPSGGQPLFASPPGPLSAWGQPPGSTGTPLPPSPGQATGEPKPVPEVKR